jgi:YidC/Oxa1 family membrane protein insertase
VRADLPQYSVQKNVPEPVVRLLDDSATERWVFQSGFRSAVGGAEPNHLGTFRTPNNDYTLAAGQDELVVTLDWVGEGPISARKTYTFRRGLRSRSHADRHGQWSEHLARRAIRPDGARSPPR